MATITSINAGDIVKNSRAVINTNFSNLNDDKAEKTDIQKATHTYAADSGAADAYVVTLSPVPSAYTAGMRVVFKAANANTGASTLNVNSLGAKTIKKLVTQDLAINDITQNAIVEVVYDGTNFQLMGIVPGAVYTSGNQTIAGIKTFSETIEGGIKKIESSFTYGETIAVNDALYLKAADSKVYKTDADFADERINNFIGFAKEAGNANDIKKVQIGGKVEGFTGLTAGSYYYLSGTAGAIGTTFGTMKYLIGMAISTTELLMFHSRVNMKVFPSDDLQQSNDVEKENVTTVYVKLKEIKVNWDYLDKIRIKFTLGQRGDARVLYARIYKNGDPFGTERSISTDTWTEFTEDLGPFQKDDLIQIYGRAATDASPQYGARVKNFRLYFDVQPVITNFTNQDP